MTLFSNGCGLFGELKAVLSAPQKISEEKEINKKWTEIIPPEPLRSTVKRHAVAVRTDAVAGFDETDKTAQTLKFKDGESGRVEAVLYDDKDHKYVLSIVAVGGKDGGFYLGKKHDPGDRNSKEPDFPSDRTYQKLEIRSDVAFRAKKIEWTAEVQK